MRWWWPSAHERSDREIAERVAEMVRTGQIKPALAHLFERALRDERDGRSIIMREPPRPRPKWPKGPRGL